MSEWWYEFFPQDISDEAALHLVNIAMDFAAALDSHYYGQIHRHLKSTQISSPFMRTFAPPLTGSTPLNTGAKTPASGRLNHADLPEAHEVTDESWR